MHGTVRACAFQSINPRGFLENFYFGDFMFFFSSLQSSVRSDRIFESVFPVHLLRYVVASMVLG